MMKFCLHLVASLLSLAALFAARHVNGVQGQFMGESLGLVIVLLSCQVCFHLNGVDDLLVDSKTQIFIQKILKSAGAGLLIAAILFYIFPKLSPGYAAAAASTGFLIFGLVVLRPIARTVIRRQEVKGTLIVGSEAVARRICEEIRNDEACEAIRIVQYPELVRFAQQDSISRIIVADTPFQEGSDAAQTLIDFKLRGARIEKAMESCERIAGKIWIEALTPETLIFADGFRPSRSYLVAKRLLDIVLSLGLLILTLPLMALIAAAIRWDSSGPAIFKQERVGFRGKKFTVYKFRSMRQDAEKQSGPAWAKANDDRVTRLGAFLRKCRLDELPQVFNVLLGEMSFIGPRPERPYFVDLLKTKIRYYDLRHYIKPGITGWAQVLYPYGASVEDAYQKLQYDLYYVKNLSFALDVRILLRTIRVVFRGEGR